ncbi:amino acid ABC transporter permease [Clostridium sediminicola]|uniref:amino acid ABC transporter permease n=1 Tax=Clostridium sediminicola TaxID=3114879 RepID=UPI0031F1F095
MEVFLNVWEYRNFLIKGSAITIQMTLGALVIGLLLGMILGMARISKNKIAKSIAGVYLTIIRGTPMLLQILFIFVGIPQIAKLFTGSPMSLDPITAGTVGIGINSAAYVAEIIRSGIQSIDKGQMEAARSLGLTHNQAMRYIILPQAFRNVIPPLGNEAIVLLKDTSLVSAIGGRELMNSAKILGAKFYDYVGFLTGAAIIYLVFTFIISKLVSFMERRLKAND